MDPLPEQAVAIDTILAAILRGDRKSGASTTPSDFLASALVQRANYHGIVALLLERPDLLQVWPESACATLRVWAREQSFWELRHGVLLTELLGTLHAHGIASVLLKGTALAYSLYGEPAERARGDTDLLIAEADLSKTRTLLAGQGFEPPGIDAGNDSAMSSQECWQLTLPDGTEHTIDLHWHLMNSIALDRVVTTEECLATKRPIPRLGPGAFTLEPALMLAHLIMHWAKHIAMPYYVDGVRHYGGERLIWANDLRLVTDRYNDADWDRFASVACEKGIARVCLAGLDFMQRWLGGNVPEVIIRKLENAPSNEAVCSQLMNHSWLKELIYNLHAAQGWTGKWGYFKAVFFPKSDYMRRKYPGLKWMPVAFLHMRRIVGFALRRNGHGAH